MNPDISAYLQNWHQLLGKQHILTAKNRAERTVNKPVFGYETTARDSEETAANLLRANPEFREHADKVYKYIDGLMRYRVDCGLITQEDYDQLKQVYPYYVPVFRDFKDEKSRGRRGGSIMVGKTIGRAVGGEEYIIPLHKALAAQTYSVVREGSKNLFGQRLLYGGSKSPHDFKKHVYEIERYEPGFGVDTFDDASFDAFEDSEDNVSKKQRNFVVREDGNLWKMRVSPDLFAAIEALSPEVESTNIAVRAIRGSNTLFKKLVTAWNPTFLARNPIRDQGD